MSQDLAAALDAELARKVVRAWVDEGLINGHDRDQVNVSETLAIKAVAVVRPLLQTAMGSGGKKP